MIGESLMNVIKEIDEIKKEKSEGYKEDEVGEVI